MGVGGSQRERALDLEQCPWRLWKSPWDGLWGPSGVVGVERREPLGQRVGETGLNQIKKSGSRAGKKIEEKLGKHII